MATPVATTRGVVYIRGWSGTLSGGALALTDAATITKAGIGVTTTAGLTIQNTTAAANGAQQYSPGLSFIGQGWTTDGAGASMPVETRWELRPVQGAAAPTYTYALMGRVNEGAWGNILEYGNDAARLSVPSLATDYFRFQASGTLQAVLASTAQLNWASGAPITGSSTADIVVHRLGTGNLAIGTGGTAIYLSVKATAAGGAALASHAISLAQDATTKVGTAPVGILTVVNTTDSEVGQFSLIGTGVVAELHDSSGNFTITKDNAATINVYYDTNGVYVQNKITATKSVRLILQGV